MSQLLSESEKGAAQAALVESPLRNCGGHSLEIFATLVLQPERQRIKYSRRRHHSAELTICFNEASASQKVDAVVGCAQKVVSYLVLKSGPQTLKADCWPSPFGVKIWEPIMTPFLGTEL